MAKLGDGDAEMVNLFESWAYSNLHHPNPPYSANLPDEHLPEFARIQYEP